MTTFTPNPQQDQAIQYLSDMVIVAHPGSGKTSVLSRKIRNIVSELRPYQGVIAISFTNKASDELERRCKADAFDTKSSFFGTIDDFCLREIIFPFARQLMDVAAAAKPTKISELPVEVRATQPTTPILESDVVNTVEFLPFLQRALVNGFIPLEAVGMLACYTVEQSSACRNYLVARYRAVFIDEYQDSGSFQHHLFLKLRSLGLTAVAVGDVDQSIYAFARKDPRYLIDLTTPNSGFAHFAITTNFRSHPSISDFALRLLDPNHTISPTNDMRIFIKNVSGNQVDMAAWLNTAIPSFMTHYQVVSADRVAILCRYQHSARLIADRLALEHYLFEESPFELTLTAESALFSDLLRFRYNNQLTAEPLIEKYGENKPTPLERRALRRVLLRCRSCSDDELAKAIVDATTRLLSHAPSDTGIIELGIVCGNPRKLRWFQSPSRDAVQIMTLHKAKGLEFDLVFHTDLHDHVIPTRLYPPGTFGQVIYANEKQCLNLHYVGITRAVKACVLMTSTVRLNKEGEQKSGNPSQFIGRNGTVAIPLQ